MASYSDTRLVSIRDNLLAPTIFFKSAPVSGYGDEIVTITLNVFCPQVGPNGELRGQAATTAYLKCSVHGAVNLREAMPCREPSAPQKPLLKQQRSGRTSDRGKMRVRTFSSATRQTILSRRRRKTHSAFILARYG